jgi:hypothetical protein
MRSVVLSDLLFILTGKRKKPFSRRTLWDHVFYMKQELRQFYPSLTDSMFSVLTKSPTKMETGIEWLLFDVGYAQSVWQSRQFVSHGKVKCNSDVLSVCAHVGSIGNLYVIKSPSVVSKLQQVACLFHGLRTFGFVFGKIAFSIVRYLYKYLLLSIRVTSTVLECVCRSRIVVDNTAMNLLNLWKGYVCDMRRSAINVIRGRDRVLAGFSKKTYSLVDRSLMFSRGSVWNRYV